MNKIDENSLLLYNRGKSNKKIVLRNSCIAYKSNIHLFDGEVIKDIIFFINSIHNKYKGVNIPISFEFEEIKFQDKLTYIFFEIICYILIEYYNHSVYVRFRSDYSIFTEGIESSPLLLLKTGETQHIKKFVDKYKFDIYKKHYRRILSENDMKDERLSKILDEIRYFLNYFKVTEQCLDELSEVVVELIGNISEHTNSNCLIDLDVTSEYNKKEESGVFYGINISVLNFSECLFGDLIKNRILNLNQTNNIRYKNTKNAYDFHRQFFDDTYCEEDFFNIASFQHKISGNASKTMTGGTGLTKLICSLEKRSDTHHCYLISGNRALWFFHNLLEYNNDYWLGFNEEKDFLNHLPNRNVICNNSIYMPGTAFNLNFVMKGV